MSKLLCILLPLLFLQTVKGQLRHSAGTKMLGIVAGTSNNTRLAGISYGYYFNNKMSLKTTSYFQAVDVYPTQGHIATIQPDFQYNFFKYRKFFYANAKLGMLTGIETLKNEVFPKSNPNIYYGETVGLGLEIFLWHRIKLDLDVEQQFWQGSLLANYRPFVKIGLNYNLFY